MMCVVTQPELLPCTMQFFSAAAVLARDPQSVVFYAGQILDASLQLFCCWSVCMIFMITFQIAMFFCCLVLARDPQSVVFYVG